MIQRRFDGSVNFDRPWEDYKRGFGNFRKEFWLGACRLQLAFFKLYYITLHFDISLSYLLLDKIGKSIHSLRLEFF